MERSTGTGFIGFGLVLIVVGAILKFAVTVSAKGFDINAAGLIAIWAGAVAVVIGLMLILLGGRSRTTTREDIRQTPTGSERVREQDDFSI
jgi:NADH:ubiquinone oxidoreductase subunit 6 (subunit J)